jgi:hypothetical protein
MQKIIFTLTANTAHHVFQFNPSTIDYVLRMYTPEQKSKFITQHEYCEQQGWLDPVVPIYTPNTDLAVLKNAHSNPKSCVFVDESRNSFTRVYTGGDLQQVWDWYVIENQNLKPAVDHYLAHPSEGTLTATIMYGSMPQSLDIATIYG